MKTITITLLLLFQSATLFAQTSEMARLEKDILIEFKTYSTADYDTRYDSLRPELKLKMEALLSKPESFDHPFDVLGEYIKIIESPDGRVRMFSWDELTGGTWHDMAVVVQFKTPEDQVVVQWIDSDISEEPTGLTDAIQYELFELPIGNKKLYMSFGWGTYGSGHHHNDILIFTIDGASLKICEDCLEKEFRLLQAPRAARIELSYNQQNQQLSFREFKYDDEIGFFQPTGQTVTLKLSDGKFIKQ